MVKRISYVLTALIICLSFVLLSGCNGSGEDQSEANGMTDYTVTLLTEGGMPVSDVYVYVYKDETRSSMLWAAKTDSEGKVSFSAQAHPNGIVTLRDLPEWCKSEDKYPLTEMTVISLKTGLLDASGFEGSTAALGSYVHDFTVTATDGKSYKASELLKTKKALVLNLWFIGCGPCRMEFPYLQQAYESYSDVLEIIAINPYDGTDKTVAEYAQDIGLTFPVASGDAVWQRYLNITAYPTTVVIDRYGMIALAHKGAITESGIFEKIFAYFTADGYTQKTVRNLSEIIY